MTEVCTHNKHLLTLDSFPDGTVAVCRLGLDCPMDVMMRTGDTYTGVKFKKGQYVPWCEHDSHPSWLEVLHVLYIPHDAMEPQPLTTTEKAAH